MCPRSRPLARRTTRFRNTRPAPCATRLSMAPISVRSSSSPRRGRESPMTGRRRRAEKLADVSGPQARSPEGAEKFARKAASFLLAILMGPALALAQASAGGTQAGTTAAAAEGKDISDYHVEQSIEFGYRFSDVN